MTKTEQAIAHLKESIRGIDETQSMFPYLDFTEQKNHYETAIAALKARQAVESRIKELESHIAESRRREQTAVEDIVLAHNEGRCAACRYKETGGDACKKWPNRSCFEWRGPQEAGEGEQDG